MQVIHAKHPAALAPGCFLLGDSLTCALDADVCWLPLRGALPTAGDHGECLDLEQHGGVVERLRDDQRVCRCGAVGESRRPKVAQCRDIGYPGSNEWGVVAPAA